MRFSHSERPHLFGVFTIDTKDARRDVLAQALPHCRPRLLLDLCRQALRKPQISRRDGKLIHRNESAAA